MLEKSKSFFITCVLFISINTIWSESIDILGIGDVPWGTKKEDANLKGYVWFKDSKELPGMFNAGIFKYSFEDGRYLSYYDSYKVFLDFRMNAFTSATYFFSKKYEDILEIYVSKFGVPSYTKDNSSNSYAPEIWQYWYLKSAVIILVYSPSDRNFTLYPEVYEKSDHLWVKICDSSRYPDSPLPVWYRSLLIK
jgi:hypothetical protein